MDGPWMPTDHDVHEVYGGHVYLRVFWQRSAHVVLRNDMIPWLRSEMAVGCDDHGYQPWNTAQCLN